MLTIQSIIQKITEQFQKADLGYGQGTENAADEVLALVCLSLDLPYEASILNRALTDEESSQLFLLAKRRVEERIPLAYLIHAAVFAGLRFYVDERVIIPRSPFAKLIETQFHPWLNSEKVHHVLELCTGSGAMAIATAIYLPDIKVDASDISKDALAVAKMNVEKYNLAKRVQLIYSDLFCKIPQKKYDLIIVNPPYIAKEELEKTTIEFKREPQMAFVADDEGLAINLKILHRAKDYLTENGVLMMEVGNRDLLEKRFPRVSFVWVEETEDDCGILMLTSWQLKKHF